MFRMICKSKIQHAIITKKDLNYSGSIGIDKAIMDASNLCQYEVVQVLNAQNGNRFETYVIEENEGSGTIALYGPATRLGEVGDTLIILSNAIVEDKEVSNVMMKIVSLDKKNQILNK